MDIWNKVKDNKKLLIIIGVIIIIGIPVMINLFLYIPVPSKLTDNSDWLSFWGSFLGGIIGGIATLLGVLLTLFQMNKDKQNEEREKYPYIIPLELSKVIKKVTAKTVNSCESIEVVNVGQQHALNVTLEYKECNYEVLENWNIENKINILDQDIYNSLLTMSKKSNTKLQIIAASEVNKFFKIEIPMLLEFVINFIVVNLIDNYYANYKTYKGIPLGNLVFRFYNNKGENIENIYSLSINCFMCKSESDEKECLITLNFNLQEKKIV